MIYCFVPFENLIPHLLQFSLFSLLEATVFVVTVRSLSDTPHNLEEHCIPDRVRSSLKERSISRKSQSQRNNIDRGMRVTHMVTVRSSQSCGTKTKVASKGMGVYVYCTAT